MFGTKSKTEEVVTNTVTPEKAPTISCVVAKGTAIEGKFNTPEDLRVDGKVNGEVKCKKKFVMGMSGTVIGNVFCKEAYIEGKIEGELTVYGRLHLNESAYVSGKIMAKKLIVDEGASYDGECLIGEKHFKN